MRSSPLPRPLVVLAILAACVPVLALGLRDAGRAAPAVASWQYRLTPQEAERDGAQLLTPELRAATFSFGPGTAPAHRQAFLEAIAGARPAAQRLIALVDGLTSVRFARVEGGHAGQATARDGRHEILVNSDMFQGAAPARGLRRTILHELGHVVDHALIPQDVAAKLDAGIPRGYDCVPGTQLSACAPREERFAETFSKWATGDLGAGLYLGYAILPPAIPLDDWGAPLEALAGRG